LTTFNSWEKTIDHHVRILGFESDDLQKVMFWDYLEYRVTGHKEKLEDPKLKFQVYLMDITSDDKNKMQFDSMHIPNPVVSDRRSGVFHLPPGVHIAYEFNLPEPLVRHLSSG